MILTAYSIIMLLFWTGVSLYLIINCRKIVYLKDQTPLDEKSCPAVTVIIAVKDEEADVEDALHSVCELDYPNYNIIVINDRSTDTTSAILSRMASKHPRLHIINVEELPQGWLGKNHALYQGYKASSDEWLLFTDADVLFEKGALKKSMRYVLQKQLDHLTMFAQITSRSSLFKGVMNTFALMLDIKLRPWEISNPSSKASLGVGAFNLVKREAYEKAGTHSVISLRPDDDLKLGERVKSAGFKQDVLYGEKEIALEWYTSLQQFVNGLMKNMFSVSNYQVGTAIGTAISTFLILVLPVPLLLLSGSLYQLMGVVILIAQVLLMLLKKGIAAKWWHALLIPFSGLVMVYIIIKSTWLTIKQGGIYWRDSFYPLTELRKQV
ncbi:glycosyltransferase [Flavisolibacter tropicus]|uniref:glycosyltransferase n=1 Tax=Flavisolibacter tropicus TaxID=1492898 RepID=UPI00082A9D13|nr:glycosyltransferase family 2 protein [Flavisolibacter tropicus]